MIDSGEHRTVRQIQGAADRGGDRERSGLSAMAGQDSFRSRFDVLYQVIINRGAEPEETPEHNALQVQFLDDDFCVRFVRRAGL